MPESLYWIGVFDNDGNTFEPLDQQQVPRDKLGELIGMALDSWPDKRLRIVIEEAF